MESTIDDGDGRLARPAELDFGPGGGSLAAG